MKKILSIIYFTLVWFICIGQTSQVVSYTNTNDPFIYFDNEGSFEYITADNIMFREQFCSDEINNIDNRTELIRGDYLLAIVSDNCKWVNQYVIYYKGIVIDMYNFHIPKTRD